MKRILLYIFWGKPLPNASSPLFSIATFRKFDQETPVFIIDYLNGDWGEFPDILNFEVIKSNPRLADLVDIKDTFTGYGHFQIKNLSRPFDVWDFSKKFDSDTLVIHSDSDIFYLQNIFPLEGEESGNFYCGKDNNGFFYFKNSSKKFFKEWKEKTIKSIHSSDFRNSLLEKANRFDRNKNEYFHNEIISCSMNYSHYDSKSYNVRISKNSVPLIVMPKCIHLLNVHWGVNKGFLPLVIKETRDSITSILNIKQIKKITNNFFTNFYFEIMKIDKDKILEMKKIINNLI